MRFKCCIVDDDRFGIEILKEYIQQVPQLEIVDIFTSPVQALERISSSECMDIIFMDVEMPLISGIELSRQIRKNTHKLVMTTAYAKYACEAFEVEADAYLLKPYSFAKFLGTVNKLTQAEEFRGSHMSSPDNLYFLVKSKHDGLRIIKVFYHDVVAFESAQNYVNIHLQDQRKIVAYLTIKDMQHLIKQQERFKQFHRGFIIATDQITYIEGNAITMANGLRFTVGEFYKAQYALFIQDKLLKTLRKKQ